MLAKSIESYSRHLGSTTSCGSKVILDEGRPEAIVHAELEPSQRNTPVFDNRIVKVKIPLPLVEHIVNGRANDLVLLPKIVPISRA